MQRLPCWGVLPCGLLIAISIVCAHGFISAQQQRSMMLSHQICDTVMPAFWEISFCNSHFLLAKQRQRHRSQIAGSGISNWRSILPCWLCIGGSEVCAVSVTGSGLSAQCMACPAASYCHAGCNSSSGNGLCAAGSFSIVGVGTRASCTTFADGTYYVNFGGRAWRVPLLLLPPPPPLSDAK